jgi:DNA-binding ferritin-like protein
MSEETTNEATEPTETPANPEFTQEEDAVLDKILESREERTEQIRESVRTMTESSDEAASDPTLTPERQRALRRAKVPESVIEKFGEDPAQLIAWADQLLEIQGNVDGYAERMRSLEEKVASQGNQPESDTRSAEQSSAPQGDGTTEVSQSEAEEGEAAPETTPEQVQTQPPRNVVEQLIGEITTLRIEQALAPFDGVTDQERVQVVQRMTEINEKSPGEFNDIASLVTKAVGDARGDLPTPGKPGPSGHPSTPPRAVTRTERPTSPDEADDAALEIILNGGTLDDAKRAAMRR